MKRSRSNRKPAIKPVLSGAIGLGAAALAAVPAGAATFTVTNLNDTGAGSLRDAIAQANGAAGSDVINFQAGLTGSITLTTGQLSITDSVDIQGPGAATLSVSGNNSSRVFYLYSSQATIDVRIAGLTVTQGSANIGAGIVDFDENLTLDGVTVTQNAASGDGGGLWADGFSMALTINNSTISGNTSGDDGGGMYAEDTGGTWTISNSVISGNQAADAGGGIYFYDPDDDIVFQNTTISGNTAGSIGGGIYLYSFDNGGMTFQGSTISGNSAQAGGGLFLYGIDTAPLVIENSTISGNQATAGDGGGIFLYNVYAGGTLNFVTVASNTATGNGGGVNVEAGTLTLNNSILADNTASANNDVDGTFDASFSLIESPGAASINSITGNILGTDPQLGTLANNGGPTQTKRPGTASPVVNAADPALGATPATDQRGQVRKYPTRADMGAVEQIGGVIQFNPTTASVAEGGGTVTLTVVRDVGTDPATVNYTTNPGSASAGSDYTTTSGTLTFGVGELSKNIIVPILDDNAAEGNETFTVSLSAPSGDATIGAASSATVTIVDDPAGTAQFSVSTANGGEGTGPLVLTVTRTGGTEGSLTVNYATANGTATAPSDFTAASGVVTFPAGSAAPQTITITINDDSVAEGDEMFSVNLTGAGVGSPASITVTIPANDNFVPALSPTGRMLLALATAMAGIWALGRRGLSAFLFTVLTVAAFSMSTTSLSAAPPMHPATAAKDHSEQKAKVKGTVLSISHDGTTVQLSMSGGVTLTLPEKSLTVFDERTHTAKRAALSQVATNMQVIVKTHTDKSGKVTEAKIRIKG